MSKYVVVMLEPCWGGFRQFSDIERAIQKARPGTQVVSREVYRMNDTVEVRVATRESSIATPQETTVWKGRQGHLMRWHPNFDATLAEISAAVQKAFA
jgi:hypothetical protein